MSTTSPKLHDGTEAVYDGLLRPTGTIPNGPTHVRARRAPTMNRKGFGPVVVVQPAIGEWRCDSCKRRGEGGSALLGHSTRTGHLVFSPMLNGIVVAIVQP